MDEEKKAQSKEEWRRLGGVVISVLSTTPKGRGFKPGSGLWIFQGDKNPQHNFLRMESKTGGPMS
jgi:hypothetical protein